ncbi:hypothetical protein JCM6882_009074 [Rhodosporidiobolus microsporus]
MPPSPPTYDPLSVDNYPTTRTFAPSSAPHPAPLPSYWTAHFSSRLTHHNSAPSVPLPREADVVIIGSGLTGSTAAAELVDALIASPVPGRKPTRIVVLEARTFCSGATGRNGGHLTAYPIAHFEALQGRYGTEDAVRAVKLEDEAIEWLLGVVHQEGWEEEVDLQEGGGTLVLYDSPTQLASVRASLYAASKAGLDATKAKWVSPAEAREKWGAASEGAVMVPGNNLYPLKFVTKLFQRAQHRASATAAAAASEKGAVPPVDLQLFTHTVVGGVEAAVVAEEGRWTVKTDRGEIKTTHVLHATNAYLSSVLPSYTSSPSFPGILPTRGQVLSLLPLSIPRASPFTQWDNAFSPSSASPDGKGINTYVFRRAYSAAGARAGDGRGEILIGGMRERAEGWEWGVADDSAVSGEVGTAVTESLGGSWPGLFELLGEGGEKGDGDGKVGVEVREEWTGIMGYREEGNPIVGPVYIEGKKQEGQWVSAGYSGHGMPRAPPCARLVASLIHHHLTSPPSSAPSPSSSASAAVPSAFRLPSHFPRHLLSTPSGKGDPHARLAEEGEGGGEGTGEQRKNKGRKEEGWVWVKKRVGEEGKVQRRL